MSAYKPSKGFLIVTSLLLLLFGLPCLVLLGWYIYVDLPYGNALRNPATRELMKTCLEKSLFSDHGYDPRPLFNALYSNGKVVEWFTTAALPNIENFDFTNIEEKLTASQTYFTPEGWCGFLEAISASGLVDTTINEKLKVTLIVAGSPQISSSLPIDAMLPQDQYTYTWIVETPVSLTFTTTDPKGKAPPDVKNAKLVVQISRSSAKTNPDHIGISRWELVHSQ